MTEDPGSLALDESHRRTLRNRRLVLITVAVIGVEIAISLVVYGWDMRSALQSPHEWETDEWLSLFGSLWILPMVVLMVATLRVYRRSRRDVDALRREVMARRQADADAARERDHGRTAVRSVIDGGELAVHFQPIVRLEEGGAAGFEALARFPSGSPESWFATASRVNLGVDLELHAARRALNEASSLPDEVYVSVNASPTTVEASEFFALFRDIEAERVVVEVTERLVVDDYERTNRILRSLRRLGCRVAVDDAGAGFASLQHIVNLAPEFIKIDHSLVRRVDGDAARRAMVGAMVSFAVDTGTTVVAEGVETSEEAAVLRDLGVHCAQGYLFARPQPASQWRDVDLGTIAQPLPASPSPGGAAPRTT